MYLSNFLRQRFLWISATLSAPRIPLSYKGNESAIALVRSYLESIAKFQTSTGVIKWNQSLGSRSLVCSMSSSFIFGMFLNCSSGTITTMCVLLFFLSASGIGSSFSIFGTL